MDIVTRYQDALNAIPRPGCGTGCHGAILGVANLGVLSGLPFQEICADLRASIPGGRRTVRDREIMDAVNKALSDHKAGAQAPIRPEPLVHHGRAILKKLIDQGRGVGEGDVWEASPVRIDWPPEEDTFRTLKVLYGQGDLLFVGERTAPGVIGENIRRASEWIDYFLSDGQAPPHIMPNPLSGQPAPKKSGDGDTFRSDSNVFTFRFCMVEFDNLSRQDQLAFWAAIDMPVSVLIDTGGKSIHGWLDVRELADVATLEAWDHHIKGRLYSQVLEPLGIDPTCKNSARLSRLPGHLRAETEHRQRILFLSPSGRKVFNG